MVDPCLINFILVVEYQLLVWVCCDHSGVVCFVYVELYFGVRVVLTNLVLSAFLSFFLSLYTAWRSLSSIIGRCTLYTPGCTLYLGGRFLVNLIPEVEYCLLWSL